MVNLGNTLFALSQQMRMGEVDRKRRAEQQAMQGLLRQQQQTESAKDREFDRQMRMAELEGKYAQMAGETPRALQNQKLSEMQALGGMGARGAEAVQNLAHQRQTGRERVGHRRGVDKAVLQHEFDMDELRLRAKLFPPQGAGTPALKNFEKALELERKPLLDYVKLLQQQGRFQISVDEKGRPSFDMTALKTQEARNQAKTALTIMEFLASPGGSDIPKVQRFRALITPGRESHRPWHVRNAVLETVRPGSMRQGWEGPGEPPPMSLEEMLQLVPPPEPKSESGGTMNPEERRKRMLQRMRYGERD
jgi:hypothetical protein